MDSIWAGIFALLGSIFTFLGIIAKQWFANKSQIRIERIKLYESDILKAHINLYKMISYAYSFWPPSDLREEFITFIKSSYFKEVKANKLFFSKEIRELLYKFEYQYQNLNESGPEAPDEFYRKDFLNILEKLEKLVEERTDQILQEKNNTLGLMQ